MREEPKDSDRWEIGGGHVMWLVAPVCVALSTTLFALVRRPLWMALWLAPVVVFSLGAVIARRRRHRPLYLVCVALAGVAALLAAVAALMPAE